MIDSKSMYSFILYSIEWSSKRNGQKMKNSIFNIVFFSIKFPILKFKAHLKSQLKSQTKNFHVKMLRYVE